MFQNIQRICNKIHLLEEIVDEKPKLHDIIGISKSWLNKQKRFKKDLIKIEDFTKHTSFCQKQHECGAVCIYLKIVLEYCDRLDISSFSMEIIFEICAIEISKTNLLIMRVVNAHY